MSGGEYVPAARCYRGDTGCGDTPCECDPEGATEFATEFDEWVTIAAPESETP